MVFIRLLQICFQHAVASLLKNLLSALLKKYEAYLAIQRLSQKPELRDLLAFEEALARGRDIYLQFKQPKINAALHRKKYQSPEANHYYFRLKGLEEEFFEGINNELNLEALYQRHQQLTEYETFERLKLHCELFHAYARQAHSIDEDLKEKIQQLPDINHIPPTPASGQSFAKLYHHQVPKWTGCRYLPDLLCSINEYSFDPEFLSTYRMGTQKLYHYSLPNRRIERVKLQRHEYQHGLQNLLERINESPNMRNRPFLKQVLTDEIKLITA